MVAFIYFIFIDVRDGGDGSEISLIGKLSNDGLPSYRRIKNPSNSLLN